MKKIFALALAAVMAISMVACGGGEDKEVAYDVSEIASTIEATNPIRMSTPIDDVYMEYLASYGLNADMYTAFAGSYCPVTPGVDIILAVEAAEGKVEEVKAVMESIKADKVARNENYIGAELEKAKAARIVVEGDVAVLVIAGDQVVVEDEGVEKAYEPVDAAIAEAFGK